VVSVGIVSNAFSNYPFDCNACDEDASKRYVLAPSFGAQLIEKLCRPWLTVARPVGAAIVRWNGCSDVQLPDTGVDGLPF
jgi:hypothetical protein